MSKIVPLHETKNFAVISCKHITALPIEGPDPQKQLLSTWCDYYEELVAAGYRPLHRLHRPEAVFCEKLPRFEIGEGVPDETDSAAA